MLDVSYEVKKALKKGVYTKNYIFNVLNTDGTTDFTIDNDNLVKESVKIDERMCSDKTLKFGLCEGSSIEFQYFGLDNITGRQIKAFCSVQYKDSNGDLQNYSIPMGYFTIEQCSTQFSTGIIKAVGYNKLMSDYLDQKANSILANAFANDYTLYVYDILYTLLGEYSITPDRSVQSWEIPPMTWLPYFEVELGTFNLTSNYGVAGPFNYYVLQNTTGGTVDFPLYIYSEQIDYTTFTGDYFQIDARYGNLLALEKNIVSYIKNMIDLSELDRTGDDVIEYICANDNFYKVFGIVIGGNKYSTVQWDYEEENGITHTVAGSLVDAQRLLTPASIGVGGVSFVIPIMFLCNKKYLTEWYFRGIFSPALTVTQTYYEYYTDSDLTDTAQADMPCMEYSDGTKWTLDDRTYAVLLYIVDPTDAELVQMQISAIPDFTLRDIQTAVFELSCQYGKLDRETDLFAGVSLNNDGLYPAENLYPANTLYPNANYNTNVLHPFPSEYEKLWTDTVGTQTFKYLIITYKDENGNEATLQRTVNADGTTNYNMSDNWLFKNLNWSSTDVGNYADAMVTEMQNISWFPFEMWAAGLPYVETGDLIEITDKAGNTYPSYILQRQLNGIQNLQDTYINGELDIF